MVNLSFSLNTLLGFLDIVGSIGYFILTINSITQGVKRSNSPNNIVLKIIELLICPISLFLGGVILFFNGWRLDPILQLQQLLFHIIIGVVFAKETKRLLRSRSR